MIKGEYTLILGAYDMADKEADSGGETEAGTVQRDVVRTGVVTISVSFSVTQKWLRLLTGYKQQEKIRVGFFDPETASVRQTEIVTDLMSCHQTAHTNCHRIA